MMNRRDIAMRYFTEGYNCSQSLVLAFSDLLPVDKNTLAALSSSFGGGMGRLREVCGGVSGMCIVLGILYGYSAPETGEIKSEHYARIQELARSFEEKNESLICRDLLGLTTHHDVPNASPRTPDFYRTRPCASLVGSAAEILQNYIESHPPKNTVTD